MPTRETTDRAVSPASDTVRSCSVLIVEDNEDVVRFYRHEFERRGSQVRVAANGLQAMEALKEFRPDVVLLDLWMPEMDGFGVLGAMRNAPKLRAMPVIVLSARGNPNEIERALSLGAHDYLVKSTITPDKVVERVYSLVSRPRGPAARIRYTLHVYPDRGDAPSLGATFFGADTLTCAACGTPYLLELTPDFSHSSPTFTARLVCPSCTPAAAARRSTDGPHCPD